jgi:SAM-dependent methyltransferase
MTTRLDREQEFHDKAFAEGTRRSAERFYAIDARSTAYYHDELLRNCEGEKVLEYGCGPGSAAFFLAEHGASVTGIDISPVAIEKAADEAARRGVAENTDFKVMNAEALGFPDDSFGLVCGTGILHHLDLARSYAEIARVLRPDGRGVFVEPMGHNPAINLYRRRTPDLRTEDEHPLLMSDLEFASKYFGEVNPRFFHLNTLAAVPARNWKRFDTLVDALGRLDDAVFRAIPPLRRYAWLVALVFARPRQG